MNDLNIIKSRITEMSKTALRMWRRTHQAFMEHDADLIGKALEDENKLNDMEKEITRSLVEYGKTCQEVKLREDAAALIEVIEDFELIGDYCKDILERVQIKIEEKLLFSDEAVKEYEVLYKRTEDALDEIAYALERNDFSLVKIVLRGEQHIDNLVDEYRKKHGERLLGGLCSPMACNMFLNMLDFTAAVYYHAKKIARSLLRVK